MEDRVAGPHDVARDGLPVIAARKGTPYGCPGGYVAAGSGGGVHAGIPGAPIELTRYGQLMERLSIQLHRGRF